MFRAVLPTLVAAVLVAAALAVGGLLTVVPAVLAVSVAERRGWSSGRWAPLALAAAAVALGGCALVLRALLRGGTFGLAGVAGLVLAAAGWTAPGAVVLTARLAPGRVPSAGRHE